MFELLGATLLYGELSPNEKRKYLGQQPDTELQEKLFRQNKNIIFKRKNMKNKNNEKTEKNDFVLCDLCQKSVEPELTSFYDDKRVCENCKAKFE